MEKEILAMKSGVELDALIDKEIFGGSGCIHELYYVDPGESRCAKCGNTCYDGEGLYSTDISAAWKVVEKLYEDGILLRMLSNIHGEYFCAFGGKHLAYSAIEDESAPVAICKAGLLAKMRRQ